MKNIATTTTSTTMPGSCRRNHPRATTTAHALLSETNLSATRRRQTSYAGRSPASGSGPGRVSIATRAASRADRPQNTRAAISVCSTSRPARRRASAAKHAALGDVRQVLAGTAAEAGQLGLGGPAGVGGGQPGAAVEVGPPVRREPVDQIGHHAAGRRRRRTTVLGRRPGPAPAAGTKRAAARPSAPAAARPAWRPPGRCGSTPRGSRSRRAPASAAAARRSACGQRNRGSRASAQPSPTWAM